MGIRPARERDLTAIRDIERVAGDWAAIGMPEIDDDEPPSVEELRTFLLDGLALVWVDDADRALAYLVAAWVDGNLHIEQVSVHPDAAGRRLGRSLLEHADGWAAEHGAPAMTLTTFASVPWNGPYYERLGFRMLADDELTDGLRRIRSAEASHGLDRWPRVAMRRETMAP